MMLNAPGRSLVLAVFSVMMLFATTVVCAEKNSNLGHSLTPLKNSISAPTMKLKDMDGQLFDIADLKGKVLVINFWATWCPPCRDEMGSMERLYQATKGMDVVVIAVNVGEEQKAVFPFIETLEPKPTFPIIFDPDTETAQSWGVKGLPTTYVVDTEGVVRLRAFGGREFDHPELMMRVLWCRTECK